jgi:pSer/pThr/pTyr-binding forkhead associated (FHA) protein
MEVQFKVLVGANAGQLIKVPGPKFFIGRSEDCHIRPRSDLVSRHHCVIIQEGAYLAVRDFGSKNGTIVNGARVVGEQELKAGDKLVVGPLEFEVCITDLLGGKKRPQVTSIKEAATRTAETAVETLTNPDDLDISEWLQEEDSVADVDTREIKAADTSELLASVAAGSDATSKDPAADEKKRGKPEKKAPGKLPPPPAVTADSTDAAAAEVLRKLRRFR